MSLTVEEVLENADYNINNAKISFQIELGKEQLKNYKIAKQLGANDEDDWDDWEDKVEVYKNNQ
tara:strand:+ start:159 stop:350 length:192 start_codon:yes stop_codon:yes gene_type:complete